MNSVCFEKHVPVTLISDYVWRFFEKISFSFFINVD